MKWMPFEGCKRSTLHIINVFQIPKWRKINTNSSKKNHPPTGTASSSPRLIGKTPRNIEPSRLYFGAPEIVDHPEHKIWTGMSPLYHRIIEVELPPKCSADFWWFLVICSCFLYVAENSKTQIEGSKIQHEATIFLRTFFLRRSSQGCFLFGIRVTQKLKEILILLMVQKSCKPPGMYRIWWIMGYTTNLNYN